MSPLFAVLLGGMSLSADHAPQPDGAQLRVSYSAAGATIIDDRSPGVLGRNVVVALKHGRLTITAASRSDPEIFDRVQNRHIRDMHRVTIAPPRMRIELSDICVDLFDGLSLLELEWVQTVLESELQHHRRRKEAATAQASVPDRWRVPGPFHPTWQETKGLILFASFALCSMVWVHCVGQVSSASAAIDGLPLDPELKLRLMEWVPTMALSLSLTVWLAFSLCRWQKAGEPLKRPHGR